MKYLKWIHLRIFAFSHKYIVNNIGALRKNHSSGFILPAGARLSFGFFFLLAISCANTIRGRPRITFKSKNNRSMSRYINYAMILFLLKKHTAFFSHKNKLYPPSRRTQKLISFVAFFVSFRCRSVRFLQELRSPFYLY